MMFVEFKNYFLLADWSALMAVRVIRPLSQKTFESYFLDMMYVEFMKKFLLADSSEIWAVRLIFAS